MTRHAVGMIKLTNQNTDGSPKNTFKQTRSQVHRQVWLQREAQTARNRSSADAERVFHVGGAPPPQQQQQQQQQQARTARPPAHRPSTTYGQGPSVRLAKPRARTARPSTAPELARAQAGHSAAETSEAEVHGKPPAPTADRRPFSPRAPRGLYDSRARGQIWIDRRLEKVHRTEGPEAPEGGHRWCGSAEARWKAARDAAPASDPMSSARSAAAAAAVVEMREQLEPPPGLPGESQAAVLRMDGYRPRLHGKVTVGHPLHFASAPFNRSIGRAAPPWRKSSRNLSSQVDSPLYQPRDKRKERKPKQRLSLYAHVPDTHFSGRNASQQAKDAADAEVAGAGSRRSSAVEGWGEMPGTTPPPTPPPPVGKVKEGRLFEMKLGSKDFEGDAPNLEQHDAEVTIG